MGSQCRTNEVDALQNGISKEMGLPFARDYAALLAGNSRAIALRRKATRLTTGPSRRRIAARIKTVTFAE
jgi:hypothetical protein